MRVSDFDYTLPPERIAQTPIEPRDSARLLVIHRDTGALEHRVFRDIIEYLRPGDLLVANQSRVLPARLLGVKQGSGGRVELLLLAARADLGPDRWEALARPGKRIHAGHRLTFGEGALTAEVEGDAPSGGRIVRLVPRDGPVAEAVARVGATPLPPYIHEKLTDPERYQTVYAREPGSAAAPTAGLHFTRELLERVETLGVGVAYVTLHIGLDTFRPVEKDDLTDHIMHSEWIEVSEETARRVNATRAAGGRIIAVGTTSTRTLEAVAGLAAERGAPPGEVIIPYQGRTALFITPGYQFRAVDALITNFHLPRSTLLALVSAFAGRELILRAYAEAIAREYRFYSFGDATLLI
ncbi:MAG TPA: tRNA preQ1(34) S-adenosylmethionine ribosyltransferase-isomerase QueA [Ktedonobacterales bacterium]|nr:tRNA preQ1(34) S-adenosylmethionine ribosyltransferase-isomerase QueA [Ktedonobacterales bacterium]